MSRIRYISTIGVNEKYLKYIFLKDTELVLHCFDLPSKSYNFFKMSSSVTPLLQSTVRQYLMLPQSGPKFGMRQEPCIRKLARYFGMTDMSLFNLFKNTQILRYSCIFLFTLTLSKGLCLKESLDIKVKFRIINSELWTKAMAWLTK